MGKEYIQTGTSPSFSKCSVQLFTLREYPVDMFRNQSNKPLCKILGSFSNVFQTEAFWFRPVFMFAVINATLSMSLLPKTSSLLVLLVLNDQG